MSDNTTLSVCILSGKGGVGKTNIALNMGMCLNKGGHRVLMMDCDLGLANLDVMLGISPEKNLQDLLNSEASTDDILANLTEEGFDLLPAASGVPELAEMDEEMRSNLLEKLDPIFHDYDFVILDLGAGITPTVLSFAVMSTLRIMVVTPEPTSLTDAYAVIKVLNSQYNIDDFYILVNQAESETEVKQTFDRLSQACNKFLNLELKFFGPVSMDHKVGEAILRQIPLVKFAPQSKAGKDLINLSLKLKRLRDSLLPEIADEPALKNFPEQKTE